VKLVLPTKPGVGVKVILPRSAAGTSLFATSSVSSTFSTPCKGSGGVTILIPSSGSLIILLYTKSDTVKFMTVSGAPYFVMSLTTGVIGVILDMVISSMEIDEYVTYPYASDADIISPIILSALSKSIFSSIPGSILTFFKYMG
jgi:hypothetical protein